MLDHLPHLLGLDGWTALHDQLVTTVGDDEVATFTVPGADGAPMEATVTLPEVRARAFLELRARLPTRDAVALMVEIAADIQGCHRDGAHLVTFLTNLTTRDIRL